MCFPEACRICNLMLSGHSALELSIVMSENIDLGLPYVPTAQVTVSSVL